MLAEFGNPGIKALDRLVASGDVVRPERGRYEAAQAADPEQPKVPGSVSARTVCTMLTVLSSALAAAMKRGLVACNVAQLIDRPAIAHRETSTWTPQQAEQFHNHVRGDRLYGCWLLTLPGGGAPKCSGWPGRRWTSPPGPSPSPRAASWCGVRARRPANRSRPGPGAPADTRRGHGRFAGTAHPAEAGTDQPRPGVARHRERLSCND